ncbi:MAG: hypothetical protein WC683_19555 [bacterium]
MERNDYGDLIERWKVDLIRVRARRLYFRKDEIDDLEQIIVQELLKTNFKPGAEGGSSERTFVIAVIDRQLMKVKRDRRRDVRRANYESLSLEDKGVFTEKNFFSLSRTETHEAKLDVKQALMDLSPAQRAICRALGEGRTQAEIARMTGRSKAAVCADVRKLAEKFRKWGLNDYVRPRKAERIRRNG